MPEIWRHIGLAGGSRVYSVAVGMASLVITARVLGPEGRGEIAAALTWAALFSTIGYLSLGQVALHRAASRRDQQWLGETLAALLAVAVAATVAGWLVAAGLYLLSDGSAFGGLPPWVVAAGMLALPFLLWEQYSSSLLMATGHLSFYNRAQVIGRTIGFATLVVLLWVSGSVLAALIAAAVGQALVAGGGGRWLLTSARGSLRLRGVVLRELLAGGIRLHINAIGTFLFLNASILVVQHYRGDEETGHFQVVVQLTTLALIVPQAATMVLYSAVAERGPDAAWAQNRKVLLVLTAVSAVGAGVLALLAPLLPLVLGEGFRPAVPILQLMSLTLPGQTFSTLMAPQWIGRGLFVTASALTLVTGLLNLGGCLLLVPDYGMRGAAWAAVGIYALSVIGNGVFAVVVHRRAQAAEDGGPGRTSPCSQSR